MQRAQRAMRRIVTRGNVGKGALVALLVALALAIRVALYPVQTSDYTAFVSPWYDYIAAHGGFAALKDTFSNYNPPYLYLLALATYLPIPKLVAIKTISVLFDGLLSLFAYLILRRQTRSSRVPIGGALLLFFAPTIILNSAAWGQADALYAAFCLGSLFFLIAKRPAWACVFYGIAIACKLQAIFFLPVLLIPFLCRRFPLRHLLLAPAAFVLLLLPALAAGRDVHSLASVYVNQVQTGGIGAVMGAGGGPSGFGAGGPGGGPGAAFGGGSSSAAPSGRSGGAAQGGRPGAPGSGGGAPPAGGRPGAVSGFAGGPGHGGPGGASLSSSSLTDNAPTFYQWLPPTAPAYWAWIGVALAALATVALLALAMARRSRLTTAALLRFALLAVLLIPFLLPKMHERYFYLADVLSIVVACAAGRWRYAALPLAMEAISLLSYAPYLLNIQVTYFPFVSGAVLLLIVVVAADLLRAFYPAWPLPLLLEGGRKGRVRVAEIPDAPS